MPAGVYKITIEQGATFFKAFTYKINGNPADLTGYTARLKAAKSLNSAQPLFTMTTENSRITLGGATGRVMLHLTAAETTRLQAGIYIYDLELVAGNEVIRFLRGEVEVSANVTR